MIEEIFSSLSEELLIATIGASVTLVFSMLITKVKRTRLEKKYPIAGDYLSEYEDESNGQISIIKTPVQLTQKGSSIDGVTEFDGRKWLLNGEISNDGYLFGIYHAESVHDKGVGNFFLSINHDGDMEGLWSGYDAVNKKIVSGRYSFLRKPKFSIHKITKKYAPAVLKIAEKNLGASYINVDDLISENNISVFASVSGKIVGFCTGKQIPLQKVYENIPKLKEMKLMQLEPIDDIGVIASVATDPDYAGRGIGSALVSHCIDKLEKQGINLLIMTGWQSDKGVHIDSIARNHGFDEVLKVTDYWKEDSIQKGYSCPSCGLPPCHCSAVVYLRHSSNTVI